MLFNNFSSLVHTIIVGSLAYVAVIVLLRVSGKRTLSKWNAFDFVVTVAFGSTLATVLLSKDTSLLQGVLGFGLLIFLQLSLTWLAVRSPLIQQLIKSQPTLLLFKGEFQTIALRKERVTESEIYAAIRSKGVSSINEVEAVILETDGSFSVIQNVDFTSDSAMIDVKGYPAVAN